MVRLIMGANGAGKTKQLIELVHAAVESESGSVAGSELKDVEEFLTWLDRFSEKNSVKFTVTISASEDMATEGLRHYL